MVLLSIIKYYIVVWLVILYTSRYDVSALCDFFKCNCGITHRITQNLFLIKLLSDIIFTFKLGLIVVNIVFVTYDLLMLITSIHQ